MATKRKKRRWTQAMRDAFARRMKRARNAKKRPKTKKRRTTRKSVVRSVKRTVRKYVKKGAIMARKRKRKSTSPKKRGRRRSVSSKTAVMTSLREAMVAIAGGIGAGFIANKLPIANQTIKAASPIAIGAILLMTAGRKNRLIGQMATGMMVLGGVAAIRSQFPSVPLLAGEEEIIVDPDDYDDIMGLGYDDDDDDDYMGIDDDEDLDELAGPIELGSPLELAGAPFVTAANM